MKKYYFLSCSVFMMALSSCSVMKSHYGRGYSVSWNRAIQANKFFEAHSNVDDSSNIEEAGGPGDLNMKRQSTNVSSNIPLSEACLPEVVITPRLKINGGGVEKSLPNLEVFTTISPANLETNEVRIVGAHAHSPEDMWLLILLAFFLPPLTVYLLDSSDTQGIIISCVLTIVGCGIPGMIYAIVKVVRKYESS